MSFVGSMPATTSAPTAVLPVLTAAGAFGCRRSGRSSKSSRESPVNIEIKAGTPGIEETVLGVLREANASGRALVVSTPHAIVKRFRKISGGHVSTGASRWEIGVFYISSRLRLERLTASGLRRAAGSPQTQGHTGRDPALRPCGACQGREGRRVDHKPGGRDAPPARPWGRRDHDRPPRHAGGVLGGGHSTAHAAMSSTMDATPKSV